MTTATQKNISLAINLCTIVVGMLLLTAASVPLYRLFCEVTGYGGTTMREEEAGKSVPVLAREVNIRFNADIAPELPWEFLPGQKEIKIKVGEQKLVYYTARNKLDKPIKGTATYNVLPFSAGSHFVKVDCFCFQEQTLEANQEVSMPILFYIDPAIMDDRELDDVKTITLSYTFFPVKTDPSK